ncbi:MAG: phosphate acyltransferase PlsX [Actinobacteria bacterium]|nr:phosphate acyltransferase PlsX [Actinomycetota bacterium]
MLPVALDAMGGDRAPGEIVAGALQASQEGLPVLLVGRPEEVGDIGGLDLYPASEVIEMGEDPASAVRRKKDSSLVRAAELVRDGKALAMVSAGNTGATMASALLRMGRIPGVHRPAIATPVPGAGDNPLVLLDAGANAECTPQMLLQFAQMGAVFAAERYGLTRPRVGLLSIGEEASKGNSLVKEAHALLAAGDGGAEVDFVGNVEGRDLMTGTVDVVVTDGFTGNVALKTLEGALKYFMSTLLGILDSTDAAREAAATLLPLLAPAAERLDPDSTGGAMLLGVNGVCIISHGSSSARAIHSALSVANDLGSHGLLDHLARAVGSSGSGLGTDGSASAGGAGLGVPSQAAGTPLRPVSSS